jgi:hypothetical protein
MLNIKRIFILLISISIVLSFYLTSISFAKETSKTKRKEHGFKRLYLEGDYWYAR